MRAYTISLVILILCSCNDGSQSGGSGGDFLTTTTDEPEGANCTWGGSFVESGLDNGDGDGIEDNNVLEDGEVDTSEYDCDVIGVAPYQLEASAFTLDGPGIAATQVCESKGLVLATWSSESELDALIQTCHLGEFDNPCFTQYHVEAGAHVSVIDGSAMPSYYSYWEGTPLFVTSLNVLVRWEAAKPFLYEQLAAGYAICMEP